MAERNNQTGGATGGIQAPRGATEEQSQSGGREELPPTPGVNALQQQMSNLSMHQPAFNIFVFNQFFGPVVQGDLHGNVSTTTNIHHSRVDSVGGQSPSQNVQVQSPSGLSEAELREYQTRVLVHLLQGLNLQEFQQPILGALQGNNNPPQRAIQQGEQHADTIESSLADIDIPTGAAIKKITDMKHLGGDVEKLVEEALIALIRDDESQKSTLDLINAYNEESDSLSSSFYADREDLKRPILMTWTNFMLEAASSTSDQHLEDNNEMKRVLARICGVLSKQLKKQNNYDLTMERYVSRADDVFKIGEDFASNKKPIHATFAIYGSAELSKLANNDISTRQIAACVSKTYLVVLNAINRQIFVIDHAISQLKKMRLFLRSIDNSTHADRIECDTLCLRSIGLCYYIAGKYQQSLNEVESAIQLVQTEFKEKANEYHVYGFCLYGAAFLNFTMEDVTKAIELAELALEVFKNVKDFPSDEEKNKAISEVKGNLRKFRKML